MIDPQLIRLRQRREKYAERFGVPDGGRYSDDWAKRIDDVLAALNAQEAKSRTYIRLYEELLAETRK